MTTDVRDQLEGDACDGELAVEFIDMSYRLSLDESASLKGAVHISL